MRKTVHIIAVLVLLGFQLVHCGTASAWNQDPHKQINFEAVKLFLNHYALSDMEKYRVGRFDRRGLTERYRGIAVASESLLIEPWRGFAPYEIVEDAMTMSQWIAWGGDWADEPHLYSSVRHFYDPLSKWWNVSYLTDQFIFHGWYDNPRVDARTWALTHLDNPFSFRDAMFYYKLSMEIPDTWVYTGQREFWYHFKLNLELEPRNPADLRGIYLAAAYRALGETMHLLGDMTQPAHVRNDAHPIDEPIEKALNSRHVKEAAAYPIVDERIAPFLKSAGGQLQSPADIFHQVALFTNQNFYSLDTIHDGPSWVYPNNIISEMLRQHRISGSAFHIQQEIKPYPSPQFKDLVVGTTRVQSHIRGLTREVKELSGSFTVGEIPMARQRLSFHWFDPEMDTLEKIARLQGLGPYHIPPSYAEKKSWVLMPIAIHACADLMHHFFPTLELKAEYLDLGIQSDAVDGREEYKRTVIEIDTEMVHHLDRDMAWSEHNLEIKYSGPARLVFERGDQVVKTRKLHFLNGMLHTIENHEGEMVQEPLKVFIPFGDVALTHAEAFYEAQNEDALYIEIRAGSRVFRSDRFSVERQADVSITDPSRRLIYELPYGVAQADQTVSFEAKARPEAAYRFVWDFGDGSRTVSQNTNPGEASTVSHTYKNLKDGDAFYPSVTLYSGDGRHRLAEDSIEITIRGGRGEQPDYVTYDCGWAVPYSELIEKGTSLSWFLYYEKPSGQRHGPTFIWYVEEDVDQLKSVICYYEDQYHGAYHTWYKSGKREIEDNYRFGQRQGTQYRWWENGNPMFETNWQEGKRHGKFINWYENGQKEWEGEYSHGEPIGIHTFWNTDGSCRYLWNRDNNSYTWDC